MGRDAKRAKQARRDKRRRKDGLSLDGVPPIFRAEFVRVAAAWDRAIDAGLMADGAETKYHFTPDGGVLSVAEGRSGQVLVNGERLTPSVAERLRREMPLLAGMITFYENNQLAGRGLAGAPEDGVMPLAPPRGPDPMPTLDEQALAEAQAATAVLVRQGKVAEPVGAMVIPAPRGVGVLFAVGGRDGELYVNGRALTGQWGEELRAKVPELSSDLDRLQAMRAEWLDSPPEDRTLALAGACTDPNCHTPH